MSALGLRPQPIWPTYLFFRTWERHAAEAPSIIAHLYELRGREQEAIASGVAAGAKSARGLFESRFNLFATDHPGLRKLTAFIGESLKLAIAQVHGGAVEPRQVKVSATESWFHITNDGGFHDSHHHHNCSWCGIYYVQVGESAPAGPGGTAGNGINRFYSPLIQGGMYSDFGNEYLRQQSIFDVAAADGLLVLFPAFLMHSALPYRGATDRIVIAFNCQAAKG